MTYLDPKEREYIRALHEHQITFYTPEGQSDAQRTRLLVAVEAVDAEDDLEQARRTR